MGEMFSTCNLIWYRSHDALKGSTGEAGQDSVHSCQVYPTTPKASARVAGALNAGLMPVKDRVNIKLGNYA